MSSGPMMMIDGVPCAMAIPSRLHQEIVFELGRQVGNSLFDFDGKGYVAPFDVRLPDGDETDDEVYTDSTARFSAGLGSG